MDQSQCSEAAVTVEGGGTAQEWLQPLANKNPFQHLQKVLTEGLCKPLLNSHGNASSRDEAPSSTLITDPVIIVQNLRNVLQNSVNFGGGTATTQQDDDGCAQSLAATRSSDSCDTLKLDEAVRQEEDEEEVEEETLAMITRPGTSRAVRVQKALETFFLCLALVYLTIRILRIIDADLGLEIYTREFCESSFISIARR